MSEDSDRVMTSQNNLEEAFQMISSIFVSERTYYEQIIESLKEKITDLESQLSESQNQNILYKNKITQLQSKLRSVANTVTRIEEGDDDFLDEFENDNESKFSKSKLNMININSFRKGNCINEGKETFNKKISYHEKLKTDFCSDFQNIKETYLNNENRKLGSANPIRKKNNIFGQVKGRSTMNSININSINNKHIPVKIKKKNIDMCMDDINYNNNNKMIDSFDDNSESDKNNDFQNQKNRTMGNIFEFNNDSKVLKTRQSSDKFDLIENKIRNMRTNLSIYNIQNNNNSNNKSTVIMNNESTNSSTNLNKKNFRNIKNNRLYYQS